MPTLADLSRQLAARTVTSRDLVEQSLGRIADPAGEGARAFTAVDAEGARAAADFVDSQRRRGACRMSFCSNAPVRGRSGAGRCCGIRLGST